MIALEKETITNEQFAVYSCICYFDVFHYPLTQEQVLDFVNFNTSQKKINLLLNELVEHKLISELNGFYFLEKINSEYVTTRKTFEKYFLKKQAKIKMYANFISKFPFVEAVCISGSCSKGLLAKDGDVDYFIITKPKKLWLCRSILIAFKKVFLFNSKKYFCINYLIDSENLIIQDKNIFVATEIRTLIPINNKLLFEKFLNANSWTADFFPNKTSYNSTLLNEKKSSNYFSKFAEFLLNGKIGDLLDKKCFNLTLSSWQKKFSHFDKEEFDLNLRSRKNVSKHHPRGYQQRVLSELNKRLQKINKVADK